MNDKAVALLKERRALLVKQGVSAWKGSNQCRISGLGFDVGGPEAQGAVREALGVRWNVDVFDWNDARGRTLEEVLEVMDKAIALLEAQP